MTSHHVTQHHTARRDVTPRDITSYHVTCHVTSHHVTKLTCGCALFLQAGIIKGPGCWHTYSFFSSASSRKVPLSQLIVIFWPIWSYCKVARDIKHVVLEVVITVPVNSGVSYTGINTLSNKILPNMVSIYLEAGQFRKGKLRFFTIYDLRLYDTILR